jgi:hypothetical protein
MKYRVSGGRNTTNVFHKTIGGHEELNSALERAEKTDALNS